MGINIIPQKTILQLFVRLFVYSDKNNVKTFSYSDNNLIKLLRSKKVRRSICYFLLQLIENEWKNKI